MYYRRNLIQILFSWFCIIMFFAFAFSVTENIIQALNGNKLSEKALNQYEYIVIGISGMITASMILIMHFVKGDKEFLKFKKFKLSFVIKPLFIYLMMAGLGFFIYSYNDYLKSFSYVYKLVTKTEGIKFTDIFIKSKISNLHLILNIISMIIFIPFIEEVIFRGVVYNDIKELFSVKVGIIVSAIIFGLLHSYDAVVENHTMIKIITIPIVTGIFGIFTAYYYEKTGTLWTSIITHSLILTFMAIPKFIFKWQINIFCYSIFILIGFIIITVELIKYIKERKKF